MASDREEVLPRLLEEFGPDGRMSDICAVAHLSEEDARALRERVCVGTAEYGEPLTTFNGRDPVQDLVEELYDAIMYMQQAWLEDRPFPTKVDNLLRVLEHQLSAWQVYRARALFYGNGEEE